MFFVVTFFTGLVLIVAPLWISKWIKKNWLLPRSIFWKAGITAIVVNVFYFGVIGNLTSVWPAFKDLPEIARALLLGLISALFIELGRFIILDRILKNVRSSKEGIYFGLGWGGVNAILIGVMMIINSFSMNFLINTQNLQEQFPEASTEQIQLLEDLKEQSMKLVNGSPLVALTPITEAFSGILIDIAFTLLILFGLLRGESRYAWGAVILHALLNSLIFFGATQSILAVQLFYLAFGVLAFFMIKKMRKMLS